MNDGKKKMTFTHDQMRDDISAENHSTIAIAIVSVAMIFATMAALTLAL